MLKQEKIDLWINNNLNVLITGAHGVGKSAIVEQSFKKHGLKYLYFSAGTMDPFVDLIGVPREVSKDISNEDGTTERITYMDLLRPLPFATDTVEAIFLDEINRAPEKVRNAVMEIIQFKSINGKKFNNLRMVWAARNPEDDSRTYDVERLDPAQVDRFHIHTEIDFKPDKEYFYSKYGEKGKRAIEWWNSNGEAKKHCSPRRLDYALMVHSIGGSLRDVLHKSLNVTKLEAMLHNGLAREKLVAALQANELVKAAGIVNNENLFSEMEEWITTGNSEWVPTIGTLLKPERYAAVVSKNRNLKNFLGRLHSRMYDSETMVSAVVSILQTSGDRKLTHAILESIPKLTSKEYGAEPVSIHFTKNYGMVFDTWLSQVYANPVFSDRSARGVISELTNIPVDLNVAQATRLIHVMANLIASISDNLFKQESRAIFGALNHCLAIQNREFSFDTYKLEYNRIFTCNLEKYLWKPKVSF